MCKPGDTLYTLALAHGYRDDNWEHLMATYNDDTIPNRNVIYPGDLVKIRMCECGLY